MDKIEKLLRKIHPKDRERLLVLIESLTAKTLAENTDCKKLQGTDMYRLRSGDFRIIFHYSENGEVVVDSIKLRNENTY